MAQTAKEKAQAMKEAIGEQVAKAQALISSLQLNADDYDLGVGLEDLQAIVAGLEAKQAEAGTGDGASGDADSTASGDNETGDEVEAPKKQTFIEMQKNARKAYALAYGPDSGKAKPVV